MKLFTPSKINWQAQALEKCRCQVPRIRKCCGCFGRGSRLTQTVCDVRCDGCQKSEVRRGHKSQKTPNCDTVTLVLDTKFQALSSNKSQMMITTTIV
eukprot:scaffold11996_cov73-Cyclotella_meneghiniana.AAC.6